MGPTLPDNDFPNGDNWDLRRNDGNGPPPLVIDILDSSDSDEEGAVIAPDLVIIPDLDSVPFLSDEPVGNASGYELLSQNPDNLETSISSEEENENEDSTESSRADIHDDIICLPTTSTAELYMDPGHIETIKDVMKSIKLPDSSLPEWSHFVPEDQWISVLKERLNLNLSLSSDSLVISCKSETDEYLLNSKIAKDLPESSKPEITDALPQCSPSFKKPRFEASSAEELCHSSTSYHDDQVCDQLSKCNDETKN